MSINADKLREVTSGSNGIEIVTGTGSTTTGPFGGFIVVANAAFSSFTGSDVTGTMTGVTFPAGMTVPCAFSAFTLSSGTVVAVKGNVNA